MVVAQIVNLLYRRLAIGMTLLANNDEGLLPNSPEHGVCAAASPTSHKTLEPTRDASNFRHAPALLAFLLSRPKRSAAVPAAATRKCPTTHEFTVALSPTATAFPMPFDLGNTPMSWASSQIIYISGLA